VEFKKREAYVTCDQTATKAAMIDALKKAGYDATVVSETTM